MHSHVHKDLRQVLGLAPTAVGIATVPPLHWQNRPTHQQVVELGFTP